MVAGPASWPAAPDWMSISTLLEVERCPARWALSRGEYPDVWRRQGYPRAIQWPTLEGTVVHRSVQRVVSALAERGCRSLSDESTVDALRELGGYTAVVGAATTQVLREYEDSPRARSAMNAVRQQLGFRVPSMRLSVQRLVARTHLVPRVPARRGPAGSSEPASRKRLREGVYSEVGLRSAELGWRGVADLITIDKDTCEIRDFKTGSPSAGHGLQLRVYALLWFRDRVRNPDERLASRLIVSYGGEDREIPSPSRGELKELEATLRERTTEAMASLAEEPPGARPSQENCTYCPVRQLCEDYWAWNSKNVADTDEVGGDFVDLQIRLTGRNGPGSWDGTIESGRDLESGDRVLLRGTNWPFALKLGQRLRVLNVRRGSGGEERFAQAEGGRTVVATMVGGSEVFLVPGLSQWDVNAL